MAPTKAKIKANSETIMNAARVLIGTTRMAEQSEGGRSTHAELELEISLTGGGVETWTITIQRTASSH